MLKSALVWMQVFCFFAGFFLCAAIANFKLHRSDRWSVMLILMFVFLLYARFFGRKLRSKLPEITGIGYRD